MSHLSTEQIEDLLAGAGGEARAHVEECGECRRRLREAEALRQRLRSAFKPIRPEADLRSRIVTTAGATPDTRRIPALRLRAALTAAALVLLAAALWLHWGYRSAGARDLLALHEGNVAHVNGFHWVDQPEQIVKVLREEIGYEPAVPRLCLCCDLEGGRQASVHHGPAGTYLVKTPKGAASVGILPVEPRSLGMRPVVHPSGATVWYYHNGDCHAAGMPVGKMSYVVVGKMTDERLSDLLLRVVPKSHSPSTWRVPCPFCGQPRRRFASAR